MDFLSQSSSDGVLERGFTLGDVPGVLWSPADGSGHLPLVLMGHGGGLHKRAPGLVARAHHYVTTCGFAVAAIDAPGHGDRPRSAEDRAWVESLRQARAAGDPIQPIVIEFNTSLAERAVPEWQTTLDALQTVPEVGTAGPVGFAGMTLATAIGIPLTATDPRIRAAVFGGYFGHEAVNEVARRITVPIEYILSWDDPELDRRSGFDLFDAFGSTEKSLRTHVGGHTRVPWSEVENSARFFTRQLSPR